MYRRQTGNKLIAPLRLPPGACKVTLMLAFCLLLPLLAACNKPPAEHHYSLFTFGTLVDITIYDSDRDTADAAFRQLQQDFDRFHQDWSPWTQGELAQLNTRLADSKTTSLQGELHELVTQSVDLYRLTEGLYNPAMGKLINLWQFHRYQEDGIAPPDDALIQALLVSAPSMQDLQLEQGTIRSDNPDVLLNFGAYAKGYAIGLGLQTLKDMGIENAIINAGGDLGTIGSRRDRPWNIGIRHPRQDSILASVELEENESVFTSGDYERVYFHDGKRYHHILDPNTGYPTAHAQSVTVIHPDPGYADAVVTALFVSGSRDWRRLASKAGLTLVMLVDENGEIHFTDAMKKRVKLITATD